MKMTAGRVSLASRFQVGSNQAVIVALHMALDILEITTLFLQSDGFCDDFPLSMQPIF
jgi:hypothetical protein